MKKLLIISALFLCSCTSTLPAMETTLSAAEVSAETYVKLPACSPTSQSICSKYDIVQKISTAREAARTAILAARVAQTEESYQVVQTAITAIQAILNQDDIKNAISK